MFKFKDIFGYRVADTRVVPVTFKIILIFTLFILVSNLTSNYITLIFNRGQLVQLMRQLLIKDLRVIHSFSNNQFEIYNFNKDQEASIKSIREKALFDLQNEKAIALGIRTDGSLFFTATKIEKQFNQFPDKVSLKTMKTNIEKGIGEGYLPIMFNNEEYFAVYKYNANWDIFLLRAEERNEFYREQQRIFRDVSVIIVIITLISAFVGIYLLRHILRFIGVITGGIMRMVETQNMELIDLKSAPNDDITYMGMAFNSLSSTIDNLMGIFKKFTNQDVVVKAYRDHEVRLEGVKQDLAILFSDIRGFTLITETLGTDIIKLLNMHYDRAIREIQDYDGIVSAIIGDALLAIFGALEEGESSGENKSYQAVRAAYRVQLVAQLLRKEMISRKKDIMQMQGGLSAADRRVFRAVLLQIGVGLDGGEVFYGTIGSNARMTNTVIGDNVNSAARLEGLTRIYQVPIICSEFIKQDIETNKPDASIRFIELDTVKVKGKTTGKKVYLPVLEEHITETLEKRTKLFSTGLEHYYCGEWETAYEYFKKCKLKFAIEFKKRIKNVAVPEDWNGIWEMKTK